MCSWRGNWPCLLATLTWYAWYGNFWTFNTPVIFPNFLSNWVNLLGIFTSCEMLRAFERNLSFWSRCLMPWRTNSLTLMTVMKIFASLFLYQIWQKMKCKGNFKQWFNVFLDISKALQGYELKASNHHLKLQTKKFSRTRDILNFLAQGLADTAFYTSYWERTYIVTFMCRHTGQVYWMLPRWIHCIKQRSELGGFNW